WTCYQYDQAATLPFAVPITGMMQSLIDCGLQAQHMNPSPTSKRLSIHLGQSLFYAWLNAVNLADNGKPNPPAVELAQQYIAHHYTQPITMDDLAEAASISVNHLTRQFNEHLHITPSRYLWQYRTQRGIELLRHTGLNISQIADRVGFATPFHFSRLVKQQHHHSPKQLRDTFWKQPS
ncbi:MAG: helix-turn-helix transcriptional regulator, partial [Phycisphaeraceae bacterium]|nr:helix-turn-helix transcriptional regulator [Phycisphaeraceae bacterium]